MMMKKAYYSDLGTVTRNLDGKGRLNLPADFREAVGMAGDEEVEIAIGKETNGTLALIITKKGGKQ